MSLTADTIKQFAFKEGASLAGVASVENFPPSVPPRPPQKLLPSARTVIVLGLPMLTGGLINNPRIAVAHTRTLYAELERISYRIGLLIESEGYRAIPVNTSLPLEMSRETRGLVGDFSLKHAAVAAGLGVWGRSHLVLNPRWGPRVRYAAIITDAPLTADAPLLSDLCTDCNLCVEACPAGAISTDGKVAVTRCMLHLQPYYLTGFIRFIQGFMSKSAEERQQALMEPAFWNLYQAVAFGFDYHCSECLTVCPVGL